MNQGNGLPPGVDPWLSYNQGRLASTAGTMNPSALGTTSMSSSSPSAAAGNFGGDASGRVPQTFQQQMFHSGFSIPTGAFGGRPQQAACSQQSTGFNAATFASALGHGIPAQNTAAPKTSAFDLPGNARPNPSNGFDPRSPMTSSPARDPNMLIAQALNQALAGEKKNIPTWNGQPGTLRGWLKLLALWEHESQLPLERRGVKLLQSFVEGSEPRRIADTIPMHILLSPQGYSAVLSAIYDKYFPYLEASAPKAIDKFLYEGERGKSESFTAYIASKQLARQEWKANWER